MLASMRALSEKDKYAPHPCRPLLAERGAEDTEDLIDAIEAVRDALGADDASLRAAMASLADLLYYLEA